MDAKIFFGAIADDFTGASDLAALLARSGAPVSLRFGLDGLEADGFCNPFEVIALKIRTASRERAERDAVEALRWLKTRGAERFFWKYCSTFDSTAKGNIGPVAEALMAEIGTTQTVYCPAFPQNGRTIYAGHLFVNDILLSDSPMRDHPLTPMRDSNLMRLLEPQVDGTVDLVPHATICMGFSAVRDRLRALAAQRVNHVVTDATEDDHLAIIAGVCQNMPLITGGSAIAAPLPALYRKAGHIDFDDQGPTPPHIENTPIIISGSCSAMTRKQIAIFRDSHPAFRIDPLAIAQGGDVMAEARDWLDRLPLEQPKLIYSSADPDEVAEVQNVLGRDHAGSVTENALANLAQYALMKGSRRFIVAGGETSGAVIQHLGITKVDIGPEISPGVPWTFANLEVETAAFALKSGNFGGERFFEDAFDALP
ncbi:MAG: 3-oxo-tetronate kinase [Pseudomonadota bacterium]